MSPAGAPPAAPPVAAMPQVAFIDGTYEYSQIIATYQVTPTTVTQDLPVTNITPGGFLRGVSIFVTSSGGALGGGAATADSPWNLFQSMTLESIDGTPLLYPMGGYENYLGARYFRPWDGDPALEDTFTGMPNPTLRFRYFIESRATLGVLPNTDARAQYRFRATINTLANLIAGGAPIAPTLTITVCLETYAQPPVATLTNAAIAQLPDGIGIQRFVSQEAGIALNTGVNSIKSNRTGNLIRTHLLIVRSSAGARTDLTGDPIRFRIDNSELFSEQRARRDYEMWRRFQTESGPSIAATARPTGVYVFPRWQDIGDADGMSWLETTEATYVYYELNGGPAAGSLQLITEDLAPVGGVPAHLENL